MSMKKLTETQKSIIKWAFVLVLLGLIVYVFRDMAGPIAKQLVKTSPWIVVLILVATLLYGVFESTITMSAMLVCHAIHLRLFLRVRSRCYLPDSIIRRLHSDRHLE